MPNPKDNFSTQAQTYRKYRPTYPAEFYDSILDHVPGRGHCWDVGTGNGQAATALAPYFTHVHATDLSARQLEQAPAHPAITYKVATAEASGFPDKTFDLITVAQALHWFDHAVFWKEVRRVARPDARLAAWGYQLIRISPEINALVEHFYQAIMGPYWDAERQLVDDAYLTIEFPFEEITLDAGWYIEDTWDLQRMEGYLRSWSSVQHYKKAHPGSDPVGEFMPKIQAIWPAAEQKTVRFPVFCRMMRVN